MAKTLCDWKKGDIVKRREELEALIRDPQFICQKCVRSACSKRVLCKPMRAFDSSTKGVKGERKPRKKRDPLVVGPLTPAHG